MAGGQGVGVVGAQHPQPVGQQRLERGAPRHRARLWRAPRASGWPFFWFDAEGDAWVRVVVRDREGSVVAEGGPWDAMPTLREWRFAAKSVLGN